jgi:hypothetical protein
MGGKLIVYSDYGFYSGKRVVSNLLKEVLRRTLYLTKINLLHAESDLPKIPPFLCIVYTAT